MSKVLPADRVQSADLTDSPLRYSGLSMSSSEQDRLLAMATILEEPVYGYLRAATAIRSRHATSLLCQARKQAG